MFPTTVMIALGAVCLTLSACLAKGIARNDFPLPEASRRAGCIDGLRGFLAVAVMFHHFAIWVGYQQFGRGWVEPANALLASLGPGSVLLFFATTGYIFYPRMIAGLTGTDWSGLYIGRVMRILPLTALSVGAVLAIVILSGRATAPLSLDALASWMSGREQVSILGVADAGRIDALVLWSLWHEWVFYVAILPLMALLVEVSAGRLPRVLLLASVLAASLLVRRLHLYGRLSELWPMFAVGMICNEIARREPIRALLASARFTPVALIALAAGASGSNRFGVPEMLLYGVFFAAVASGNSLFGLLTGRGALILGECSFSVYLLHGIVLWALFTATASWQPELLAVKLAVLAVAAVGIVTALALCSYLGVERPAVAAGNQARHWVRQARGAAPLRPARSGI